MYNCKEVQFDGGAIQFVDKAKYLGVMLKGSRKFGVDLQYMKSNFYQSFNSVFHMLPDFSYTSVSHLFLPALSVILHRMSWTNDDSDA